MCPAAMLICWNKRKCLLQKRVELPQDWPTWQKSPGILKTDVGGICVLTYDVFTGCLTLKLDVKNTSRPHPHPPPQPWFQTLSPGKKERVRDQGCASPKNAFWDFVHANNCQQLRKYKKHLLNQWQLHFKWSKVLLCNFLIKLNKTDRTSENKGTILEENTWNKSSTIYLRDLQTSNGRLQGLQ